MAHNSLLLLLFLASVCSFAVGDMHSVTVKGQVTCADRPQASVEVQLWESDALDPDDLLNTTRTDDRGKFRIFGQEDEMNKIEPYLLIIHNCDNGIINPKCTVTDRYNIPSQYVDGLVYEIGIINLNIEKSRKKNCD